MFLKSIAPSVIGLFFPQQFGGPLAKFSFIAIICCLLDTWRATSKFSFSLSFLDKLEKFLQRHDLLQCMLLKSHAAYAGGF